MSGTVTATFSPPSGNSWTVNDINISAPVVTETDTGMVESFLGGPAPFQFNASYFAPLHRSTLQWSGGQAGVSTAGSGFTLQFNYNLTVTGQNQISSFNQLLVTDSASGAYNLSATETVTNASGQVVGTSIWTPSSSPGTISLGSGYQSLSVSITVQASVGVGQVGSVFFSSVQQSFGETPITATPAITVDKQISIDGTTWYDVGHGNYSGPTVLAGDKVYERVLVTDSGNTALSGVNVTDLNGLPAGDFTFGGATSVSMAAGQTITSDIGTVTASSVAGTFYDTATATGTVTTGGTVTSTDKANYTAVSPSISIDKQISVNGGVTWQDVGNGNLAQDPVVLTGATVDERVIVVNTGGIALNNATVGDVSNTGGAFPPDFTFGGVTSVSTLAVGQTIVSNVASFTASVGYQLDTATVTATATDTVNTATVAASDQANYTGTSITGNNTPIVVDKQISVDGGNTWQDVGVGNLAQDPTVFTGSAVEERVIVSDTGSLAITNVSVSDAVGNVAGGNFSFGAGNTVNIAANSSVTSNVMTLSAASGYQLDTATATGTVTDSGGNTGTISASDQANYTGVSPAITVDKQISVDGGASWHDVGVGNLATDPIVLTGATVEERVIVTNTGSIGLTSVSVADSSKTGTFPADFTFNAGTAVVGSLGAGQSITSDVATFTASTGQQLDTATATGTATDSTGATKSVSASDQANYIGVTPAIAIDKQVSVNGGATWVDVGQNVLNNPVVLTGATVEERVIVTNTGSIGLGSLAVIDTVTAGTGAAQNFTLSSSTLAAGASETSNVVSFAALSGYQKDQAGVSGTATDSSGNKASVSATDQANYTGIIGAISLDKQVSVDGGATWQDVGKGVLNDPTATTGGTVLERVIVVNTGSIALNNISVSDAETSGTGTPASFTFAAGAAATLAAGATLVSNAATLTAASGHNVDTATATGTFTDTINTGTVSASDQADYTGTVVSTGTPGISVLKVPSSVVVCSGHSETYTFYVTNTGSVALNNVTISDNIGTAAKPDYVTPTAVTSGGYNVGDTNHNGILNVGETWQFTETVTLVGAAAAGGSSGSGDKSGSGGSKDHGGSSGSKDHSASGDHSGSSGDRHDGSAGSGDKSGSGGSKDHGGSSGSKDYSASGDHSGSSGDRHDGSAGSGDKSGSGGSKDHGGSSGSKDHSASGDHSGSSGDRHDGSSGSGDKSGSGGSKDHGGSGGSAPVYTGVADTVTVTGTTAGGTTVSASDTKEVIVLGSGGSGSGSGSGGSCDSGSSGSGDQSGSGSNCNSGSSGSGDKSGSGDNNGDMSGSGSSGSGDKSGSGDNSGGMSGWGSSGSDGGSSSSHDHSAKNHHSGSSGSGDKSGSGDNSGGMSGWGSSGSDGGSSSSHDHSGKKHHSGSSGSGDKSGSGDNSGGMSGSGSSGSGDKSGSGDDNGGTSGSGSSGSGDKSGQHGGACNSGISLNNTAPTGNLPTLYGSASTLEFTYNPGSSVSLAQGSTALATVTGSNANALAFMEFSNNANPVASNSQIYFEGSVKAGENIFTDASINPLTNTANSSATNHFSTASGAALYGFVFTSQAAFLAGQQPIETTSYSTAASHGMSLGDTIGSAKLVGYIGATGGHLIS